MIESEEYEIRLADEVNPELCSPSTDSVIIIPILQPLLSKLATVMFLTMFRASSIVGLLMQFVN